MSSAGSHPARLRLGFLGAKYTTIDCMRTLIADGFVVDQVITIDPDSAAKNAVAGYVDVRPFAKEMGLPVYQAKRYDLKTEADASAFNTMNLDVLLVIGWERLVPPEILGALKRFACGMHGSAHGLPRGRGRSPLNWALILGEERFVTSLFIYDAGVDAGKIIGTKTFDITEWDDIETLHLKNRLCMNGLLRDYLPLVLAGEEVGTEQDVSSGLSFYPRRRPEDGAIDWNLPAGQIHRTIRALTRPYPGAFSTMGNDRYVMWRATPIRGDLFKPAKPGEVLEVTVRGAFAVATGEDVLLVQDFEAPRNVSWGARFESVDSKVQLAEIRKRYPPSVPPMEWEV